MNQTENTVFAYATVLHVDYLVSFSVLKMEAIHSSETSLNFYQVTLHHIREDRLFMLIQFA
jgi:hypothetical protein